MGGQPRIAPGDRDRIGLLNYGIAKLVGLAAGGQPPHVFTTLARNRKLFRRWLWFAGGLMPGGKLPRRDTELVILRVAHNTGCDYERHHHERLGLRAGLSAEEIERAGEGPDAQGWSPRQARLLRAADELHADGRIGDGLWAELSAELDDRLLIELCLLIGHYEMLAMTLNTLRVQPDPAPIGRRLPRWLSKA
jgi:AhpD family alkylhydroperoxidase